MPLERRDASYWRTVVRLGVPPTTSHCAEGKQPDTHEGVGGRLGDGAEALCADGEAVPVLGAGGGERQLSERAGELQHTTEFAAGD